MSEGRPPPPARTAFFCVFPPTWPGVIRAIFSDRLQATTDYEFSTIVSIVAEKLDVHPGQLFDEWCIATDRQDEVTGPAPRGSR